MLDNTGEDQDDNVEMQPPNVRSLQTMRTGFQQFEIILQI
jgi:hypothetical protein